MSTNWPVYLNNPLLYDTNLLFKHAFGLFIKEKAHNRDEPL